MKKGQTYTGIIEKMEFPNKGILHIEGERAVVKNALPGQKVRFVVNKKRNGRCEGRLLEVEENSPLETASAPCPHFGRCGGCLMQTIPYEQQLTIKEGQVKALLEQVRVGGDLPEVENKVSARSDQSEEKSWVSVGGDLLEEKNQVSARRDLPEEENQVSAGSVMCDKGNGDLLSCEESQASAVSETRGEEGMKQYAFEGIKPSPISDGYRNKMEFSFGDEEKGGPLALGLHRRGSFHDIVNTDDCHIVHGDFNRILTATREYFAERSVSFYRKLQHQGYLRHLLVRRAVKTGEILAALVTSGQTEGLPPEEELLGQWTQKLLALPLEGTFAGILHIRNDSLADVVQSDETRVLYGQEYFYEELLGLKFKISPFSFFQTNSMGAEVLYETVRQYIGDTRGKTVFDLYSGTGTIAQILAPVAEKVIGVEIVEEAVRAARENAAMNGLDNCQFIGGDVLKVVGELETAPDLIILDPPRDGIHPKALDKIIDFGADRMVYVSCKPTSLVRDLEVLTAKGYEMEKVCCVDMFPATANVEVVCRLVKRK